MGTADRGNDLGEADAVNDLKTLPARLQDQAAHIRAELARDPSRSLADLLADLLAAERVSVQDGARIADSIHEGAGAEWLR